MRCPSCGARGAPEARFCDRCGSALPQAPWETTETAAPVQGDRRVVTALFADLVDYVRMLAEHDPEVVRARVTAALATMADSIERLGGTREKFIGDAVFAVFGWPTAHDDDALRAALAALSIRAALQDPSAAPGSPSAEPLDVRIGIATGEVVAGRRKPGGDGDLGLTGEAITTAARIQSLAQVGEILMDAATVRAARGRLATEPRGTVVLRGQSTPVELLALRGEAGMSAWTAFRVGASGPLVGRESELDVIRSAIERCARTGRGQTVVVVAEAGMGKTRLLEAAESIARREGFAWTWTESVSYGRGEPYRWARLFAQTVADEQGVDSGSLARRFLFSPDMDADTARRFGGAIAAIARDAAFSGWEAEAPNMLTDPSDIAAALMEVAARYLDRMVVDLGPRVVVIDDLHWLDASSEGMVELMMGATATAPMIVLAGTRPDRVERWLARPDVTRLELAGLAEHETARLATLVARAAVEADDARRIHERTAGNPLFVGETVRAFLEDGTLARRDGRVALTEEAASRVPLTLRAVLGARIDALEPDARAALDVAAIIGVWFRPTQVEALLAQDGIAVTEATWTRLVTSAMVAPAEPDGESWRFAHALIHDAAYAGMLATRRRRLHEQVADHLESRPGSAAPGHIGMHRAAAGDVERALPLLREAAASAMALGAADESARLWQLAAELGEPTDADAAAGDRRQAVAAMDAAILLRETAGLEAL